MNERKSVKTQNPGLGHVGTFIKSIPRLKVDATNPPKSDTNPPPRLIRRLFLSPPSFEILVQAEYKFLVFLFSSPFLILTILIFIPLRCLSKNKSRQYFFVFECFFLD